MKALNKLVIAAAILGSGSAFAATGPVDQYLMDQGLLSADSTPGTVIDTAPADNISPVTRYLSNAGLVEVPVVTAQSRQMGTRLAVDDQVRRLLADWGLLAS